MLGRQERTWDVALSVIVPVFREAETIRPFLDRVLPVLERTGGYEVLFCLDPCEDGTEEAIRAAAAQNNRIGMLLFSRRFGQPAATMAGILNCHGESCVVIDVDLQDPPSLIEDMFRQYRDGYDVVYAQRRTRAGETWIKRLVSWVGYKLINRIANVHIPPNTGDFRLISRRVIEELRMMSEGHGFLRGLVGFVGFKQAVIRYDRDARLSGTSKYNSYLGSLKIGFNGIVGFSTSPLSLIFLMGIIISAGGTLGIVYIFLSKFILGIDYPIGLPTITVLILFLGGVQLISIGVLGEYLGRTYDEVRRRPLYIVDKAVNVEVIDYRGPRSGPMRDLWPKTIATTEQ